MPETLLITVRDEDMPTLQMLAEREWRAPHLDLQASALLAVALAAARVKASAPERTRAPRRRGVTNGLVHAGA